MTKLGDFIICGRSSEEAFALQEECNIAEERTIHIIGDEIESAALFQFMSGESETSVDELNESGALSRILVGSDNEAMVRTAVENKWGPSIWSGIVILEVETLREYRKVYPVYTS